MYVGLFLFLINFSLKGHSFVLSNLVVSDVVGAVESDHVREQCLSTVVVLFPRLKFAELELKRVDRAVALIEQPGLVRLCGADLAPPIIFNKSN